MPTNGGSSSIPPWRHADEEAEIELLPFFDACRRNGSCTSVQAARATPPPLSVYEACRCVIDTALPFFTDPASKCKACALSGSLVVVMVLEVLVGLWFTYLMRDFMDSLKNNDQTLFRRCIDISAVRVVVVSLPVHLLLHGLRMTLCFEWRRYLTELALTAYLDQSRAYYHLKIRYESKVSCVDNPDQRIAQDIPDFVWGCLILMTSAHALVTVVSSAAALVTITVGMSLGLVAFYVAFTVITLRIFWVPLMNIHRTILVREANFRFSLVRLREHAEAIAFLRGEGSEFLQCMSSFASMLRVFYNRLLLMLVYTGSNHLVMHVSKLLPYVVLAPAYFQGRMSLGSVQQAHMLLTHLVGGLEAIDRDVEAIGWVGVQASRVHELFLETETVRFTGPATRWVNKEGNDSDARGIVLTELSAFSSPDAESVCIKLKHVTVSVPYRGTLLVSDISLTLSACDSLLITGESGIGKTALMRALSGLWSHGNGLIEGVSHMHTMFFPQHAYVCLGSLRQNALYVARSANGAALPSDTEVERALNYANMGHLIDKYGLDANIDLESALSRAEKQSLALARLLLFQGSLRVVFLDEATHALDAFAERRFYNAVRQRVGCYVSVGPSAKLARFHNQRLALEQLPNGGCTGHLEGMDT